MTQTQKTTTEVTYATLQDRLDSCSGKTQEQIEAQALANFPLSKEPNPFAFVLKKK